MRIANWFRVASLCLIVFSAVIGSSQLSAKTPSGTLITNQAEISWFDTETGTVKNAFSNVSSVVVAKQYDLLLEQDNIRHTTAGKKVDLPHRLTNTGNTSSEYEVRIRHNLGDSGDLETLKVYTDSNANGVSNPGEPEWTAVNCEPAEVNVSCYKVDELDPGELQEFVITGFTSTTALVTDTYTMNIRAFPWEYDELISQGLTATSQRNSTPEFEAAIVASELPDHWVDNDFIDIIEGAVLNITKIATPTCGVPARAGAVITYQIGYTNIGGDVPVSRSWSIDGEDVTGVVLEDVLPANLTLKKAPTPVSTPNQSVVIVQRVEDEDTGRWISFSSWNGTDVVSKIGLFVLTSQVQPNQSGSLDFSATVNPNVTTSVVYNQAFFDLVDGGQPEFVSNSVCTNIEPANTRSTEGANPDANPDASIRFLTPTLDIKRLITQSGGVPDFYNDNHFEDVSYYSLDNGLADYDARRDGVYIEMDSSSVNTKEDEVDTIEVTVTSSTGDTLRVMMIETGENTNIFRSLHQIRLSEDDKGDGALCPATSMTPNFASLEPSCVLQGAPDGGLTVTATVSLGNAAILEVLKDAALIAPLGVVFDSAYNTEIPGAAVTIRNASDGSPALDPITLEAYPAQITGDDGKYQFPILLPNQDYYLDVVPPATYSFPSTVDIDKVGSTGNGTIIRTVTEASYGIDGFTKVPGNGVFTLDDLSAQNNINTVDIPLDPILKGDLTIEKSASLTEVSVGGTINYTIKIKNNTDHPFFAIKIEDTLPRGFKYVLGTTKLNGVVVEDPAGAPQPNLTFTDLPFMEGQADGMLDSAEHTLEYSVRTTAAAIDSDGINRAVADGHTPTETDIVSNVSNAIVKIKQEGVLSDSGIIFGKVFVDADCNNIQNGGEWPIAGVKLYLEDGTWVKTDANGQFSLYGLESSNHVIKIDPITVPKGIIFKPTDNRQMADPNSRLVDLTSGEFHRADFVAACPKEDRDEIFDEIKARNVGQTDWMLENAQKYDATKTSATGDLTKSTQADGDISSGSDLDDGISSLRKSSAKRTLSRGYSIQVGQFADKELAEVTLENLPATLKAQAFIMPMGDFQTVRIGFDLNQKSAKKKLQDAKLGKDARVVATIYERLTDEVANQLESPTGLALMVSPKELVKDVTNDQAKAGTWLWPQSDASLDGRFMVVVRKGLTPTLMVNGKAIPKSQIGEQIENRREKAQVVAWYGVKLEEGDNKLEVVAKDMFGNNRVLAKGSFKRPASAYKLKISTEMKQLPADGGRSYLPVTIKLLDKNDYPARGVNFVTIEASDGQWVERDIQSENEGRQIRVVNGMRVVNLRSSERSGDVKIRVSDGEMSDELDITQIAPLRPLLAVGLVEIGANAFERDVNSPFTDETSVDSRVAGFMKGRIRGDMHLTMSVDTSKDEDSTLFRDINPAESYPIHGDSSQRGYEAQSRSKVYVKLEKDLDSVMWGDFVTDGSTFNEDVTSVKRSLTGANLVTKSGSSQWQFFVSEQDEDRVVEQIRGKGVALNYKLNNVPMVANSETIEIITVSRDNPGIVLTSRTLTRFGDYTIDSVTGELSFNDTIPSSDSELNPVHIRASYDVEGVGTAGDYTIAGARVTHALKPGLKVGASYTIDQHDTTGFELYGVTMNYEDDNGLIARGSLGQYKPIDTTKEKGTAGRLYVSKKWTDKSKTSITLGQATSGFTSNSAGISADRQEARLKHEMSIFESVGEEYKALAIFDGISAEIEAIHSKDLTTEDTEQSVGVTANMTVKGVTVKAGVRHIQQSKAAGDEAFQTFIIGAKKGLNIAGRKGSIEGEYEQDFDSAERRRIALTADMQVHEKVNVYARGERINSLTGVSGLSSSTGAQDTISVGVKSNLLPSTELFSEYRVRGGISGRDLETASGVRGTYEIKKGLSISPHFEVVKNIEGTGSDSVAASVAYKDTRFDNTVSSLRLETRHDDVREYYGLQADYATRLSTNWSALLKNTLRFESPDAGDDLLDNTLTLGMAYRPLRDNQYHALFYYQNKEERGGTNGDCSTHILSTHQNYAIKEDVLISGRLGAKTEDCNGSESDAVIADGRITWDITNRFDVDLHGGVLGTNGLQEKKYSIGVGANYLVRENLQVGVGYNVKGFKDDDLDPDNYNDQGVYMGLKYKFDENSLNWLTGE